MDTKKLEVKVELPEIVNKTLEKPAEALGDKISDLIEIIFGGITYKKEKMAIKRQMDFEKFRSTLMKKIDEIPMERRSEPKENIIGPTLEAAKFRIDADELREMFATLIASSLDSEKVNMIHPCFIEIIKNLSVNDAKAVETLSMVRDRCIVPIISISEKVMSMPNNMNHYCLLSTDFGFKESNIIISSLQRLGLIEINYVFDKHTSFQNLDFEKMEGKFAELRNDSNVGRNLSNPLTYRYGAINLTALGYEFAKVCSPVTIDELRELVKNFGEFF